MVKMSDPMRAQPAGGAGGCPSDASNDLALNWFRFTRILLDVVYPLLRRLFRQRFRSRYGIDWTDDAAAGALFVHGGVIGGGAGYDGDIPGTFAINNGNDIISVSADLTGILTDGMFTRVGVHEFVVRKSTNSKPSVQPPKDHLGGHRSNGKVLVTTKHDGPDYVGADGEGKYATRSVPPMATFAGGGLDGRVAAWCAGKIPFRARVEKLRR